MMNGRVHLKTKCKKFLKMSLSSSVLNKYKLFLHMSCEMRKKFNLEMFILL